MKVPPSPESIPLLLLTYRNNEEPIYATRLPELWLDGAAGVAVNGAWL